MRTGDFDFELPAELIAQSPPVKRGDSRMMVIDRAAGTIDHHQFAEFESFVGAGDLCVFNDTRVVPARFFSNDGGKELLRLDRSGPLRWECLVRPGKRLREGKTIEIGECIGTVVEVLENGNRIIEFDRAPEDDVHGHLALPPYIEREDDASDRERYQTVYADKKGAVAAPTAGLHFSEELMQRIDHAFVTLHVGLGTFRPVSVEEVENHDMHSEWYSLPGETARRINRANRVIAVGTTVVRVLESCYSRSGLPLSGGEGDTDIFIYPPYDFGVVGGLLTNFHLPKSTLLMLVSAFAGRDLILESYARAVESRYRFFSYGDCMLIL